MNLGQTFLDAIELGSLKPNIVVVFSPNDRFFTTQSSNKPNSSIGAYDGSQSHIFWKHEPDSISDEIVNIFDNHLGGEIGDTVPLDCIDAVNITGSEIDLKDASTQDDSVEINVVLDNVADKGFFQDRIGDNVEVYFGFSGINYDFSDYERFYVGRLVGINNNSTLSLSLRIGNIADYWNRTWRHSRNLNPTKLAYAYPLNDEFQKIGDGDRNGLNSDGISYKPEWALRQIAANSKKWGFDFRTFFPDSNYLNRYLYRTGGGVDAPKQPARPEYEELQSRLLLNYGLAATFTSGRSTLDYLFLREYPTFYPTALLLFEPSGTLEDVRQRAPELLEPNQFGAFIDYPEIDQGFLNHRGARRLRFKIDSTIIESEYADSVLVYPFWVAWAPNVRTGHVGATNGYKSLVNQVVKYPQRSATIARLDRLRSAQMDIKFFPIVQGFKRESGQTTPITNTDPYTKDSRFTVYGHQEPDEAGNVQQFNGPAPRFNFATKLRLFVRQKFNKVLGRYFKPDTPSFSAGANVQFYDLFSGIGTLNTILLNTLRNNLGIPVEIINVASLIEAESNWSTAIQAPRNSFGTTLSSDYAFSGGGDDIKEHIELKILKSNNLRLISDGGVLRCIFLGLNNLKEKQSTDGPFLLSEDDILEPTVYETRQQDRVSRLKIRTAFNDLENDEEFIEFYAHDNRSPDRQTGEITVTNIPPENINDLEHEEIDVYTNFTEGSPYSTPLAGKYGMVGPLFKSSRFKAPHIFKPIVESFARDYFNVVNPFIKLTVVAGPRAIGVDVGDIITIRDHKSLNLFGSQFIKVLITNKSISSWGTETVQVTLDCLYMDKSVDFLESSDVEPPKNLRLVSRKRSDSQPYTQTDVTVAWDEPDDWGQDDDTSLYKYEVVESTPTGERVLFKLDANRNSSPSDNYRWTANNRNLRFFLDNPTTYHIFVRADNGALKSRASNILSIDTFSTSSKPSAPLNLRGTVEGRVAVLNWDAPMSNGGESYITYNLYVNDELFLNIGRARNYRYNVEGNDAENVSFYVTAQNSKGESDASNEITLDFQAATPAPTGTIELRAVENGINAARLIITHNLENAEWFSLDQIVDGSPVFKETFVVSDSPQQRVITGLDANTNYCYRVTAYNTTGQGPLSNVACVTTLADNTPRVPGPVRNLRTTDVQSSEIDVAWDAPLDEGSSAITNYRICWSTDTTHFTCFLPTDLEQDLSQLAHNTTYYIKVSAVNAVGEGPSELIVVNTLGTTVAPTQPTIEVTQTEYESPFEVRISIDLPNLRSDAISQFVVERSTDNVSFSVIETDTTPSYDNNVFDTTNLSKDTTYYYRARTTNSAGNSIYSEVKSVIILDCESRDAVITDVSIRFSESTAEQRKTSTWIINDRKTDVDNMGTDDECGPWVIDEPKSLSKIRNLDLGLFRSSRTRARTFEVDLSWSEPQFLGGYPIARYDVNLVGVNTYTVTSKEITLLSIEPATSYTVRVRAVNTFGSVGPWESLSFTTTSIQPPPPPPPNLPGKPTNLRIEGSNTAIDKSFEWDAPSERGTPPLTGYLFRIYSIPEGLFSTPVINEYRSTDAEIRIRNLQYFTVYTATVRAINANGMGPESDDYVFRTEPGQPSPPTNIRLSLVGETSVKVDWDKPIITNGNIVEYTIYYRELASGADWDTIELDNVMTHTIDGFDKGKTYEFDMTADAGAGPSNLTGSAKTITIPQYEKPGIVRITCQVTEIPNGDEFIDVRFFAPSETGGADLYQYQLRVVIEGVGERTLNIDYRSDSQYESLITRLETAFGLTTLPSGLITFEARARNTQSSVYSDVDSTSRCSLRWTAVDDFSKKVSNIRFSRANNKLIVRYTEPTDTRQYEFELSLWVTNNASGTTFLRSTNLTNTKAMPDGTDSTFEVDLTASQYAQIFTNKTINAVIFSTRLNSRTNFLRKTQVYETVVSKPNAPNVDSVSLYSDNIPRIQFDYPQGTQPVTGFRVYEVDNDTTRLVQTIPNTFSTTETNIVKKVGTTTYTAAGTYNFFMRSYNSAGESTNSNQRSFTIDAPPPPPPTPMVPNSPRVLATFNRGGVRYIRFRYPTGTQPVTSFKVYAGSDANNLPLVRTIDVSSVTPPTNGIAEYRVSTSQTFINNSINLYFQMRASNAQGDSPLSNVVIARATTTPPAQTRPNAPNVRRVSRDSNNMAQIVFDYPVGGPSVSQFKVYEVVGGVTTLRRSFSASRYRVGQTSIRVQVHSSREYTATGTYTFLMRASNANGDSADSNRVSFTIAPPPTPPSDTTPHFVYNRAQDLNPEGGFELYVTRTSRAWPTNFVSGEALFWINYVRNNRTNTSDLANFFPHRVTNVDAETGALAFFRGAVSINSSSTTIECQQSSTGGLNVMQFSKLFDYRIYIHHEIYSKNRRAGSSVFVAGASTYDPTLNLRDGNLIDTSASDPEFLNAAVPTAVSITSARFPRTGDFLVSFDAGTGALGWRLNVFNELDDDITDDVLATVSGKFKYTAFSNVSGPQVFRYAPHARISALDKANLAVGRYKITLTAFNLRGETESAKVNTDDTR